MSGGPIGLLDLLPQTRIVKVGEQEVEVGGLSSEDAARLLKEHSGLGKVFLGRGVTVEELADMAPGAVKSVIAAGFQKLGDAEYEAKAASLPMEVQADLIEGIVAATWPAGFGPFVKRVVGALGAPVSAPPSRAPSTRSASPSPSSESTETQDSGS
jgi:hypothetical protein